jgi:L-methionine (R)-S-oxide reductase
LNTAKLESMKFIEDFKTGLKSLGCISGCIHIRKYNELELKAQVGLPRSVVSLITSIPKGKGMAGQAWVRRKPIMTCNLKTDHEAPIEPGAREVDARSAVAIPVTDQEGEVAAVVGFAFGDELGFDELRLAQCEVAARRIVRMAIRSEAIDSIPSLES